MKGSRGCLAPRVTLRSPAQRACLKAVCQLAIAVDASAPSGGVVEHEETDPLALGGAAAARSPVPVPSWAGCSRGSLTTVADTPAASSAQPINTGAITALISVMHTGDFAEGPPPSAAGGSRSAVGSSASLADSVTGGGGDVAGLASRDVLSELLGAGGRDLGAWVHTLVPSELVLHPHAHLLWPTLAPAVLRATGPVARVAIGDDPSVPHPAPPSESGKPAPVPPSVTYGLSTSLSRALLASGTSRDRSATGFTAQLAALAIGDGPGSLGGADAGGSSIFPGFPSHLSSAVMLAAAADVAGGASATATASAAAGSLPRSGGVFGSGLLPTSIDLNRLAELQAAGRAAETARAAGSLVVATPAVGAEPPELLFLGPMAGAASGTLSPVAASSARSGAGGRVALVITEATRFALTAACTHPAARMTMFPLVALHARGYALLQLIAAAQATAAAAAPPASPEVARLLALPLGHHAFICYEAGERAHSRTLTLAVMAERDAASSGSGADALRWMQFHFGSVALAGGKGGDAMLANVTGIASQATMQSVPSAADLPLGRPKDPGAAAFAASPSALMLLPPQLRIDLAARARFAALLFPPAPDSITAISAAEMPCVGAEVITALSGAVPGAVSRESLAPLPPDVPRSQSSWRAAARRRCGSRAHVCTCRRAAPAPRSSRS